MKDTSDRVGVAGRAVLALLIATAACAARAAEGEWRAAQAPLVTRWAKEVDPKRPRPEYPRPQLARKEWLNLNGLWDFALDQEPATGAYPLRILVPFTFESALSGIGRGREVHERVYYRRTFTVRDSWWKKIGSRERVLLHFGACDWETTAWLNGRKLGTHRGGYTPFTFDITPALKPGTQELKVAVYDPADPAKGAYQPKGKQLGSEGIWYTRTTGIWQTVWLEPVPPSHVTHLKLNGEPDGTLRGTAQLSSGGSSVRVTVSLAGEEVASVQVLPNRRGEADFLLEVPRPHLWSPANPTLYDLDLAVESPVQRTDTVHSYTAFRRYDIRAGRLALNGKPYFLRGVLDQGYWPDGIYTPPTDAAIRAEVAATKAMGFNMARKHVKVEDPRWYYWCDRLGLAVWQDMPSSHNLGSMEARDNFAGELKEMVEALISHPSIVHWVTFNENWGDPGPFQDQMVNLVRAADLTRPITDASGWTQRGLTDVIDVHDYGNDLRRHAESTPRKPKVVGEFGGIALPVVGHTWSTGWGYQSVRTPQSLLRRISQQVSQLLDAPGISGYVYTQLTDVEQELNGLLTYDRIPKAPLKEYADVFTGRVKAEPLVYLRDWRVLGPIPTGAALTSFQRTPENERAFTAALAREFVPNEATLHGQEGEVVEVGGRKLTWVRGKMNGDVLDLNANYGGEQRNSAAYAVTELNLPAPVKGARLLLGADDSLKVWLNGKEVWRLADTRGVQPDSDEVAGLDLPAGRNVLVVKVVTGVGGWGLSARLEDRQGKPLLLAGG
jgi:hypothetical protein